MFGRDAPRQPEKRFRFLVGQCQPIFPFHFSPHLFLRDRRINVTRGILFFFILYFSWGKISVSLFRFNEPNVCRANEKTAFSTSAYEKSSSHDWRTSENSILSGLVESRLAQLDRRAVLCTYTPLLSFSPPLDCTLFVHCPYCKWYTMEIRTARIRSLPAPRVYFCNFVFCIAPFSAARRLTRPITRGSISFVNTTVQPSDTFDGSNVNLPAFHLTLWESAARIRQLTKRMYVRMSSGIIYWLSPSVSRIAIAKPSHLCIPRRECSTPIDHGTG